MTTPGPDKEADTGEGLTASEAARLLEVSERTIRRYLHSGRLPARQVYGPRGREYRILPTDVESLRGQRAALEGREIEATQANGEADREARAGGGLSVADLALLPAVHAIVAPLVAEVAALRESNDRLTQAVEEQGARLRALLARVEPPQTTGADTSAPPRGEPPAPGPHPRARATARAVVQRAVLWAWRRR